MYIPRSSVWNAKRKFSALLLVVMTAAFIAGVNYSGCYRGKPPATDENGASAKTTTNLGMHERLVVINIDGLIMGGIIRDADVDDVFERCITMYAELKATISPSELPRMDFFTLKAVKNGLTYRLEVERYERISPRSLRERLKRNTTSS